jgi:processive 1,2-diacylglycerol beta-glucosyltransferase
MMAIAHKIRRGSKQLTSRLWSGRAYSPTIPIGANTTPRILILSASVGNGHIRCARAIQSALMQMLPDAQIAHVDVLELTNFAFRRAYGTGYFRAVERMPRFVGWMYDFLDHPGDVGSSTAARLAFEQLNLTRLKNLLTAQPWDLAINTHFLSTGLIARLRRRSKIHTPQVTVVTDFDVHGLWINRPCERFFVATPEARANIAATGVPEEHIPITGIPIDPIFAQLRDRNDVIRQLGLKTDRPILLQMAAGFGISSIRKIHQSILDISTPLQIVVVTSKSGKGRQMMQAMDCPSRHTRHILGFSHQMHDLLLAADAVVTKPGGLTTSECLASGCPMIIVQPIPGQEDRNADFLLENGCGIKINNLACLTQKVSGLLSQPERLGRMRAAALDQAHPHAAFEVAAQCLSLLPARRNTVAIRA